MCVCVCVEGGTACYGDEKICNRHRNSSHIRFTTSVPMLHLAKAIVISISQAVNVRLRKYLRLFGNPPWTAVRPYFQQQQCYADLEKMHYLKHTMLSANKQTNKRYISGLEIFLKAQSLSICIKQYVCPFHVYMLHMYTTPHM